MDQVFVTNALHKANTGTAVTDLGTIGNLADGALVVMARLQSTAIIPIDLVDVSIDGIPEGIAIYQQIGTTKPRRISPEFVPGYYNVRTQAYSAGTTQALTLGNNGTTGTLNFGTIGVGVEYGVELIDLRKPEYEHRTYTASFTVTNASMTAAQVATKVASLVNADPKMSELVTAVATSNTKIVFTGTSSNVLFTVIGLGGMALSTVHQFSTQAKPAIGTYEEVLEAERRGTVSEGNQVVTETSSPIYKVPFYATAGNTYEAITIAMKHMDTHGYGVPPANPSESFITIYYKYSVDSLLSFNDVVGLLEHFSKPLLTVTVEVEPAAPAPGTGGDAGSGGDAGEGGDAGSGGEGDAGGGA